MPYGSKIVSTNEATPQSALKDGRRRAWRAPSVILPSSDLADACKIVDLAEVTSATHGDFLGPLS